MAAVVESTNSGGKFSHISLILKEDKYQIATGIPTAMVIKHTKPDDINPKFKQRKRKTLPFFASGNLKSKQEPHSS